MNIITCRLRMVHTDKKINDWFCQGDLTETKTCTVPGHISWKKKKKIIVGEVHDRAECRCKSNEEVR